MRLTVAAALVTLSAVPSTAAYLVDFGSGDRMTVDSYWEDGDHIHLMRDGVELSVPRARIRRLQPDKGAAAPSSVKRTVAASPHREAASADRAMRAGRVPRMPRWLRQPRHGSRAWYCPFTLASGSDPRHESRVALPSGASFGRFELRRQGQPPDPAGSWAQSASEVTLIVPGSAPPPADWLASASASEL